MRRAILRLLPLSAALLLAGCGNKGPLVLPHGQPGAQPAPAATVPADSEP